jgi:hypothetical protein
MIGRLLACFGLGALSSRHLQLRTAGYLEGASNVMYFAFFRHWLVALTVAALVGCASGPIEPPAPAAVSQGPVDRLPDAASKCKIPGFWYFKGSCVEFDMTAGPLALAPYKGLTTKVNFPPSNAPPQTPFIVGEGTNATDITGTYGGKKFPLFGSISCLNTMGQTVTCPVAADFLYLIIINASPTTDVRFNATPAVTVTSAAGFPGKKCGSAVLEISGSTLAYVLVPKRAKLVGGTEKFPPFTVPLTIPHANFLVFGFYCA